MIAKKETKNIIIIHHMKKIVSEIMVYKYESKESNIYNFHMNNIASHK